MFYDESEEASEAVDDRTNSLAHWILDYRADDEFEEVDANEKKEMLGGVGEGMIEFSTSYQLHLASRGDYGCEAIRYAWNGVPIFPTEAPKPEWSDYLVCPRCHGSRVFEVCSS